jgi:hypothetical protein
MDVKHRILKRGAGYRGQFNPNRFVALDIFSSRHVTEATSRTKKVKLASTRHAEAHEVTLDIMLQPPNAVCCEAS